MSQRVFEAIKERNLGALRRWLNHPRFDSSRADNSKAVLACLQHEDSPVWLSELKDANVSLRAYENGSSVMEEAIRMGNREAVAWLLGIGFSARVVSLYGNPVLTVVLQDFRGPKPSHDAIVGMLWDEVKSMGDLFGRQSSHIEAFVRNVPSSWVKTLLERGWDPEQEKDGEPNFLRWAEEMPGDEGKGFSAAISEWQLENRLQRVSEAGKRPRL